MCACQGGSGGAVGGWGVGMVLGGAGFVSGLFLGYWMLVSQQFVKL